MQEPNKPIWFKQPGEETSVRTINLGGLGARSPHRIMVCTPCHSDTSMHYTQAVLKFQQACIQRNILVSFTIMKSSLVTQGRNLCVAEMLNHEDNYTHLLFIDSDIDFKFQTIETMLEADKDVIACPYPLKQFSWDKAWQRLQEKDGAIETAQDLAKSGYTFPLKLEDQAEIISEKGIVQVTHAPTGCMLIKRKVLEDMIKHYPELEIHQPTFINGKETKLKNTWNLFDTIHDPKTKQYFGEDFGFCEKWGRMGGKIYVYIMDYISHVGDYCYTGRFFDDLKQGETPSKHLDEDKKIK
tara:strand:+ start:1594 stop:2487 length:894 start_codon:yes stop_codon:yes gene_type:complete